MSLLFFQYRGKWFEDSWRPPGDNPDPARLDSVDYTFTIIESAVDTHDTQVISFR